MATEVKLPRLGQGMESGTIVKWLKGEGEPVKKREPLYELDTDKVTQEVEAEKEGISVEVIDPRTLLPLDEDAIIDSVKKTTRAVTAHEAVTRMGFGAELAAVIQYGAFDYLDAPIERVGSKFAPLAFAPQMEQFVVPHAADVLAAIRRTVGRNGD